MEMQVSDPYSAYFNLLYLEFGTRKSVGAHSKLDFIIRGLDPNSRAV